MFRKLFTTRSLCISAMVAALYAVITLATPVLSYGAGSGWECRLSEALTMLAVLFPEAVPGLTV
ncbi:MAG: QueT transporter family protein, partial [Clostridia bacterium]|nr:QueT transporter family protein [Clostridia bacterium]